MTNTFTAQAAAQAVALGLAAVVTLGVLFGINGLAANEYQAAQPAASAQAAPATPTGLRG